jgi:hypothetical protein
MYCHTEQPPELSDPACEETEINKQLSIPASEDFGQKKMEIRQQ